MTVREKISGMWLGFIWAVVADRSARASEELARAFCGKELGWSCAICLNISKQPY